MTEFMAGRQPARKTVIFWLLILVVAGVLTATFWNYTQDDVFITYAFSRNLAEGQGLVFNAGERVQGTTTPLYALLMTIPAFLRADMLHTGNLLSTIFLLIATGLGWNLLDGELSPNARRAYVLTAVVSPLVYVSFGMETLCYTMLLMLSFWLWKAGRNELAMLVAAALTWTRADGIVLGGTLGLLALIERWQPEPDSTRLRSLLKAIPWKLWLVYGLGVVPWFLFAWLYFGSPLPNTFGAKQEILHGFKFWTDGWGWWQAFYGNNWLSLLAAPLVLLGLWQTFRRHYLRPIGLWAVLYAAGYTLLNVTAFWYYTPWVLILVLLTALGGDLLVHQTVSWKARRWAQAGAIALVVVSAVLAVQQATIYGTPPQRVATYELAGRWIEANTPDDATLLLGDLGIVGYHANRITRDVPGLIVPDMYFKQEDYAILKYRTDFVFATGYFTWVHATAQGWFDTLYRPITRLSTAGDVDFSPMTVYERRWPTRTPQQAISGAALPLTCDVHLSAGQTLPPETTARLLDNTETTLAETGQPFMLGHYPDAVPPGQEIIREQILLPLNVPPGTYQWEMSCDRILTGTVEIVPPDAAEHYTPVQDAEWEAFAQLRGVILSSPETWSGGTVTLSLDWQALSSSSEDYSVFVHLVDSEGQVLAQTDGYPANDSRPSSQWVTGERILDEREIDLPADLPAGEYELLLGWYDWRTGDRLFLADGSDSLRLPLEVLNRWPGGSGLP